ncbi:MAG: S-layer homology domain-containing protein [Firmicutes bacterium]|nr:S-layer homology domain-containing protein [Bacillota bacterium]
MKRILISILMTLTLVLSLVMPAAAVSSGESVVYYTNDVHSYIDNAVGAENGSLLHVAGLKYTLDLRYDSTVQADEKDVWTGAPTGEYPVKDVQVWSRKTGAYEPPDLSETYRLAGYNYTLRDLGGGFAMLNGATNVLDYAAEDYMVPANYIKSFPVSEKAGLPTLTAENGYADVFGSGRISILNDKPLHINGVELNSGEYLSEGGQVTDTAPTSGYAHYKNGVLTLSDYTCQSEGYLYDRSEDGKEYYYALIYSEDSLQIELIGDSALMSVESAEQDVYVDGIVSEGSISVSGYGTLLVEGFGYGIRAREDLAIRDTALTASATENALRTYYGTMTIENSDLTLTSEGDGIYAGCGLAVADSTLNITAQADGIYSYENEVSFDKSDVTISAKRAIKADEGALVTGEGMFIFVPEQGFVKEIDAMWDSDDDGIEDTAYRYHTIVDADGKKAGNVKLLNENASASRAEVIYDLWMRAGKPVVNYLMTFTDVAQDTRYTEAIRWAASEGIAAGYGNSIFGPDAPITRQQLATVLYRYEQKQGGGFKGNWMFLLDCTDRAEISEWAYEPMCWMTMHGILSKDDERALRPREAVSRIQADQILTAYCGKK